ncbi:MAG: hypothetical protein ACRCW1_00540 [Anaerotignaceae bacterium]
MDLFNINLDITQFTYKMKKLKQAIKTHKYNVSEKEYTIEEIEALEVELVKIKDLLKNVDN